MGLNPYTEMQIAARQEIDEVAEEHTVATGRGRRAVQKYTNRYLGSPERQSGRRGFSRQSLRR